MKSATYIVRLFLDMDRPDLLLPEQWVHDRIALFEQFTLKSLLNQSFGDFRIFLLCGERHRAITEAHKWHPRVEVCYDRGMSKFAQIKTPHLSITRLDSDDLMHKHAMREVRDNAIRSSKRECMVWRNNIMWDRLNRYIGLWLGRAGSPFVTHVFPYAIYRDRGLFETQHFQEVGKLGDRSNGAKVLSENKICVVRHNHNISLIKRGLTAIEYTAEQRAALIAYNESNVLRRVEIRRILEPFGVAAEQVK